MKIIQKIIFVILLLNAVNVVGQERKNNYSLVPVQCNPGTFWINFYIPNSLNQYDIIEYNINGNQISMTDTILSNIYYPAIGYGYDLYNSTIGKTLYGVQFDFPDKGVVYNGFSWDTLPYNGNYFFFACAGHDSTIVFEGSDFNTVYPNKIFIYDGINFNDIYTVDSLQSTSFADLAVDIYDNIWFFTAYNTSVFSPNVLVQINKTGTVINKYFISHSSIVNSNEGFGSFIFGNKLYVGVGPNNPLYPNSLLPFEIIGDSVYMDTPISLNCGLYDPMDAESCNQGSLTALPPTLIGQANSIFCYPNPASEFVKIYGGYNIIKTEVYNINGELIEEMKQQQSEIDVSNYAEGLYFIKRTSNQGEVYAGRFIKIRSM